MIAIIGAMPEEVSAIAATMNESKETIKSGIRFIEGTISDVSVVLMQSGVGKTASAVSTVILMENYELEGVINVGTAGGLQLKENVLDVVISSMVTFHDLEVPGWTKSFDNERFCYKADPDYIECIRDVISKTDGNVKAWIGPIVSGDMFVCEKPQVEKILHHYPEALCAEMEAGSIAQVCRHYEKPFIVIRSLSDITLKENNGMTFEEYLKKASERSAVWCQKFLEALSV